MSKGLGCSLIVIAGAASTILLTWILSFLLGYSFYAVLIYGLFLTFIIFGVFFSIRDHVLGRQGPDESENVKDTFE